MHKAKETSCLYSVSQLRKTSKEVAGFLHRHLNDSRRQERSPALTSVLEAKLIIEQVLKPSINIAVLLE